MMESSEPAVAATAEPQTEMTDASARPTHSADVRAMWVIGLTCLFVYAYFYQGNGYNQHAHFATVRAIVERGTLEITPYKDSTGDVSYVDGRIYAAKSPGLALLATPVYFVLYHVERWAGADVNVPPVWTLNIYLLTVWTVALPTVLLMLATYGYLRREGWDVRGAMLMTGSLAFGTLLFPYAGTMMVQNAVAACLFVAWLLVRESTDRGVLITGALLGAAVLMDQRVAPLIAAYAVAVLLTRPSFAQMVRLSVGLIVAAAILVTLNWMNFGGPFSTSYHHVDPLYKRPGLFLGVFHWPRLSYAYWLTVHPHRGLFYCCPMLALAVLGFGGAVQRRRFVETSLPLAIFGYFFLFNLSFYAWTGGWGVGPRFLMPAIPFLSVFVARAAHRFPRLTAVLVAVSIANMFTVTAVCLMVPTNDSGPPMRLDPVFECYRRLFSWHTISMQQGSFNLGLLLKMPGLTSLLLPLAALGAFGWYALTRGRESSPGSMSVLPRN
jgi:hypothetical protein